MARPNNIIKVYYVYYYESGRSYYSLLPRGGLKSAYATDDGGRWFVLPKGFIATETRWGEPIIADKYGGYGHSSSPLCIRKGKLSFMSYDGIEYLRLAKKSEYKTGKKRPCKTIKRTKKIFYDMSKTIKSEAGL